jgi:hypothetical protein
VNVGYFLRRASTPVGPALGFSAVSLLTDLDAFYTEHRRCGELEADVDEQAVWIECECGASITRKEEPMPMTRTPV